MIKKSLKKLFRKLGFKVEKYNLNTSQVALMERLLEYQYMRFSVWVLTLEDYCQLVNYS